MNRRGFLGTIAAVLTGAKLLPNAKAEPRVEKPPTFHGYEVKHAKPISGPLHPLTEPRTEIILKNSTGRGIFNGQPCRVSASRPTEALIFHGLSGDVIVVIALEDIPRRCVGRFLLQGIYP